MEDRLTYEEALSAAKALYYAHNPTLDAPPQDFTVPSDVFDAIEHGLHERQGLVYVMPDPPNFNHILFHGVRMIRGSAPAWPAARP